MYWPSRARDPIHSLSLLPFYVYTPLMVITYCKHNINLFHKLLGLGKIFRNYSCFFFLHISKITLELIRREFLPLSILKSWFFTSPFPLIARNSFHTTSLRITNGGFGPSWGLELLTWRMNKIQRIYEEKIGICIVAVTQFIWNHLKM